MPLLWKRLALAALLLSGLTVSMSRAADGGKDATLRIDLHQPWRTAERPLPGINVNYLMDHGRGHKPDRPLAEAIREMGARYLRYPGGDTSDSHVWSAPHWQKPQPTLTRTGLDEWPAGPYLESRHAGLCVESRRRGAALERHGAGRHFAQPYGGPRGQDRWRRLRRRVAAGLAVHRNAAGMTPWV